MYNKSCPQMIIFVSFSIEKVIILQCPLFHLTSSTPTKSNVNLDNFLAAAVIEPNLYGLLTFQVRNLMSPFRCLVRTKVSFQVRGKSSCFLTKPVVMARSFFGTSRNPYAVGTPLVCCPLRLIQYIRTQTLY